MRTPCATKNRLIDTTRAVVERGALLASALLLAPTAWADPSLTTLRFGERAQSHYSALPGLVESGTFAAEAGGSATGPAVAIHAHGRSSIVTADNEASAQAFWSFEIVGPAGVAVPLLIGGVYGAETGNDAIASGGIGFGIDQFRLTSIFTFRCSEPGDPSGCDSSRGGRSQSFTLSETALSGYETFISIGVGGTVAGAPTGVLGSFDAFLDPLITIDPTFARAGEFTLFVSPGAEDSVAAVPEPETYALLLAGFAIVGSVARRRSRA